MTVDCALNNTIYFQLSEKPLDDQKLKILGSNFHPGSAFPIVRLADVRHRPE